MKTYNYINDLGTRKFIFISEIKGTDTEFRYSIYTERNGVPCDFCSEGIMTRNKLNEFLKLWK